MHKFFVPNENIYDETAIIEGEDVKHIYKVLRLREGEKIGINNCAGKEYIAEIVSIDKKEVKARLLEECSVNNESPVNIVLFQGLPKSSKMDLIVQKASEIGINEITPIVTKRVVVQSELGEFSKTDRWRRIALEACKQSKRTMIPAVNVPISFEVLLKRLEEFELIVVPYENEDNFGIKDLMSKLERKESISNIAVIIGPEGGFEETEILALKEKGAYVVTLGPRILRTETAGFVCSSILQYELGDMGGIYKSNVEADIINSDIRTKNQTGGAK